MIRKSDDKILRAFLNRESRMYDWGKTGEKGRRAFVKRMFDGIVKKEAEPCNYVHIKSITNMGLVDSQLVLSGHPWDTEIDAHINLPPSPNGGLSFSFKPRYPKKE